MTVDYPNTQEIEARIETLAIAFRAIAATLTYQQASLLKSKVSERIEEHLLRPEPVNETDPYALEMRSFAAALLQDGPEQPVFGD